MLLRSPKVPFTNREREREERYKSSATLTRNYPIKVLAATRGRVAKCYPEGQRALRLAESVYMGLKSFQSESSFIPVYSRLGTLFSALTMSK